MIRAEFFSKAGQLTGFKVSGHSGYADAGADIVCAAVSSAVQLTANGVLEILGEKATASAKGSTVTLYVDSLPSDGACAFLEALRLQLSEIADDYPTNLKLTCTEV